MAYDNGFDDFTLVGVILAISASFIAAVYKVKVFKKIVMSTQFLDQPQILLYRWALKE